MKAIVLILLAAIVISLIAGRLQLASADGYCSRIDPHGALRNGRLATPAVAVHKFQIKADSAT